MRQFITGVFLLLITVGCVDRIYFDIPNAYQYGISISGHITTTPGPHRVNIFRTFDTESKDSLKSGVTARSVVISDAEGNSVALTQVKSGIYETAPNAITGKVGGIYKVTVELIDGPIYESTPDTLQPGGVVDTAYYIYEGRQVPDGYIHEYSIKANSSTGASTPNTYFMWSNKMTYKSVTRPELELKAPCYLQEDNHVRCNFVAPCSGLRNVGTNAFPDIERVGPCTCCTCWYNQFSQVITLSDKFGSSGGRFVDIPIDRIELTGWNMMFKMRIEVSMQSLSLKAYLFWKAVRDQRNAVTNIFQPVTGKIPGNIIRIKGPEDRPAIGIFYATATHQKVFYIERGDTPVPDIPTTDFKGAGWFPCERLAPNASNVMPDFWIE